MFFLGRWKTSIFSLISLRAVEFLLWSVGGGVADRDMEV